jgi:malate dehydrogenase (oxaloacetate-decarboxylating)
MFMAAAKALATLSPAAKNPEDRLLPSVTELRSVSVAVASAVARQAQQAHFAPACDETTTARRITSLVWQPEYQSFLTEPA